MDYCKRSGQIPAFGDWDYANDLPITQYFECARQAGLIRFSSSSGESNPYNIPGDLYTVDLRKHSRNLAPARKVSRVREKKEPHVKEQKKAGRVCDVTEPPRKYQHQHPHHVPISSINNNSTSSQQLKTKVGPPKRLPVRHPKPVDEDLYKIPPELLRSSKRKKMPGFFSCLVPSCAT
ncbi:uncharacterized protein LOC111277832 isoform X2 [Durio zibethinus]|uniref:Uncharacterized protein LOC111277832 isoform X2 n=1 Tax=Durio zibethinus TaxID=66656 RepID=A0A6P5WVY7_DURZI|nr:uncharacterized protein LOC111277832 isoform X2 [Durio zibethinus]